MDIADVTAADIQNEIIAPIIINEFIEQVTERMEDGIYMNILAGYTGPVFQDYESYLRTEIDFVEDDLRLVLDKFNSKFITYELETGNTPSKIFPKLFLISFNLNIQDLVT